MTQKNGDDIFNDFVKAGEAFSFRGTDRNGTMGTQIVVYWADRGVEIHTSCSKPLGVGLRFGPFTVVGGASRRGGEFCGDVPPLPPPPCDGACDDDCDDDCDESCKSGKSCKSDKSGKSDKSCKSGKSGKSDKSWKRDKSGKSDKSDKSGKSGKNKRRSRASK